ncbi:N-acetylmuramoyl-L-alanine amidase [Methylobacterium sp. NFXW15]|uniref:N-acetylmuramoyl-L-alanine amidase n=1 Tax=Methylobacterium sp. NFXW15 TaxID=2819512 RepID=UPI003CF8F927
MLGRIQLIRSVLFGLAATLALALPLRAQDSERGSAVAIAADLSSQGAQSKLTLTLSKAVEARAFIMERPDRVVIDLPEVNFQLDSDSGRRRDGVVQSFRYGLFAPGRSRIVIDLASPATVGRIDTVTRPRDGAVLMTIPLQRVDRDSFRKAAASSDPRPAPAQVAKTANTDPRPLIVIDAGHGGTDPGAIASTGVFEKDIVFGFAQDLAEKLNAAGRYRVQMTRDRDVFVPLNERVRIAREAKADLFISIHADSISSAPQVRGATIYTGSEKATDAESAKLAERENRADAAAGAEAAEATPDIADILQELTLRETRGFSSSFARNLMGQLAPVMEMSTKPHREARFVVLRSPDVPSVLVELGYLSSKRDLEKLQDPDWRAGVTGSMAKAIEQFFATRTSIGKPGSGTRRSAAIAPVSP